MPGRRQDNRGARRYPRSLRVNQVLRQVLAEELERLADADERLRLVTVTSVDTAPDLRHATVYLSTLEEEAAEALEERRAQLQRTRRPPDADASGRRGSTFAVDPAVAFGRPRVEEAPAAGMTSGRRGGQPTGAE